jgi:hypothetical protein
LVTDLECLLHGEPPQMARKRLEAVTLLDLAKGEAVEHDEDDRPGRKHRKKGDTVPALWLYIAGVILIFSLVGNLILALR